MFKKINVFKNKTKIVLSLIEKKYLTTLLKKEFSVLFAQKISSARNDTLELNKNLRDKLKC